jgi:AraC-like DNA-binding protein
MNWELIGSFYLLLAGFIGFVTLGLILFSIKSNKLVNVFLVLVFFMACARMLIRSSFDLNFQNIAQDFAPQYRSILLVSLPLIYLYFNAIIEDISRFRIRDLIHFTAPFSALIFNICALGFQILDLEQIRLLNFFFSIGFAIVYLSLSYRLLTTKLWKHPTGVNSAHFRLIKNWTMFVFAICFFLALRLIVSLIYEYSTHRQMTGFSMTAVQATFWLILFIKVLLSPEILFGLPKLNEKVHSFPVEIILHVESHWNVAEVVISNQQDKKLKEKIDPRVVQLIEEIEYLADKGKFFRNQKVTIHDIANELNVPVSHIVYVFKYHCKLSFIEYKTLIKIEDAKQLIESGFLSTNTLESLAAEVGFSSYNPFFTAFKKLTSMSPNEYAISLNKSNRVGEEK